MRKVWIVAGPTASGKTKYAIEKAKEIGGEIINCDSLQIYDELKTLTAYPTKEEMDGVPHKLFGYLKYNQKSTVADWATLAAKEVEKTFQNGKIPIIAGGSGLYINILTNGISPLPEVSSKNRKLAEESAKNDYNALCDELYKFDPELRNFITNDKRRQTIRAYEIFLETGKSILRYFKDYPKLKFLENVEYEYKIMEYERAALYEKINERLEYMLQAGAIEEVKQLLSKIGCDDRTALFNDYPIFKAIGAKEITLYLDGIYSFEKMKEMIKTNTRHYAKRQITWFKYRMPN
ncbi:MAG: tRNA (adenosine(37)-N6)-dimethylallyltransferase MiaA [Holosporales bacterium]|jgi:tRNA dimethylallyltransferase|nr:tRNA (adenosine(37)-N6)-dimethylallyltransferase MiaA [Holosporales bacterium]